MRHERRVVKNRLEKRSYTPKDVYAFFERCIFLDHLALKPLSHIRPNWELTWDGERYVPEEGSFAEELNEIIDILAHLTPPRRYHDSEDQLASLAIKHLGWKLYKKGGRWYGAEYDFILETGSLGDVDRKELLLAAAGRVEAALVRGQTHFDSMEEGHMRILGAVLCIAVYRTC